MNTMSTARLANLVSAVGSSAVLALVLYLECGINRELIPAGAETVIRLTVVITWIGYLAATFSDRLARHIDQRTTDILHAINALAPTDNDDTADATEAHLEALEALQALRGTQRRPHLVRP